MAFVLGIIAGKGDYPKVLLDSLEEQAEKKFAQVIVLGIAGDVDTRLFKHSVVSNAKVIKMGKIGEIINDLKKFEVNELIMAGQITPHRFYTCIPDQICRDLYASCPQKNAHTLFRAFIELIEKETQIKVLPATSFIEHILPEAEWQVGAKLPESLLDDVNYAFELAKEVGKLNIGQTVVIKEGGILAVEGFEGTNHCIRRGGKLGKEKGGRKKTPSGIVVGKVARPNHDMRFDVPTIGPQTIKVCHQSGIKTLIIEAKKTLILEKRKVVKLCQKYNITLIAKTTQG